MRQETRGDARQRMTFYRPVAPSQNSFESNRGNENADHKNFLPKIYNNILNVSNYNTKFRDSKCINQIRQNCFPGSRQSHQRVLF